MLATEERSPIMLRLKQSTQALHDATEAGDFNRDLVKGKLPRELYVKSLEQLCLIHRCLEAHLRAFRGSLPALQAVLRDYHFQEPYLLEDLRFFGRAPQTIQPLPSTRTLLNEIDRVAAAEPIGLLGFQYVFEGSNNGSKFISRAVKKAYELTDAAGTTYLDPYGDQQQAFWRAFKEDMNAASFTPSESLAIINSAERTFEGVMSLHRELHSPASPTAGATLRCPHHQGE